MQIFHSDPFPVPLPPGHRFPMEKYGLLKSRVEAWLSKKPGSDPGGGRGASMSSPRLVVSPAATDQDLLTVHTQEYLDRLSSGTLAPQEIRRMGFPWSEALVERSRRSVGGTLSAARAALSEGVGTNLSGGTHHAFPGRGEGYCVFNDVAVATRVLQQEGRAGQVLIIDLDVHQGNGTAFIFQEASNVFTLSVHGANNYPFKKVPSDLDLELSDQAGDGPFLETVSFGLTAALAEGPFDLAFYVAGADPFVGDRLGRLAVSKEGLEKRDHLVFSACREARVPVAVAMGGGYASPICHTVDIYFQTVLESVDAALRFPTPASGLS